MTKIFCSIIFSILLLFSPICLADQLETEIQGLRGRAEQGDASAMFTLGAYYGSGYGVPQSQADQLKWFLKAAKLNYTPALEMLGSFYANTTGDGIQNIPKSIEYYTKAAELNSAPAQEHLGMIYQTGEGIPVDLIMSYMWYRIAQKYNESANAASALSFIVKKMTPEQIAEGERRVAAWKSIPQTLVESGDPKAELAHAEELAKSNKNAEALEWYLKAAQQNLPEAEYALGLKYVFGAGVKEDTDEGLGWLEAYKWFYIAKSQSQLEALEATMTPDQVMEAKKRAAAFQESLSK